MTSLLNYGMNIFKGYKLSSYLNSSTTMSTLEISKDTLNEITSNYTEEKDHIEAIRLHIGNIIEKPEEVKSEENVTQITNCFELIKHILINGHQNCMMFLREKLDSFKIYSSMNDLNLDFTGLNKVANEVISMLEDDETLEDMRKEAKRIRNLEKVEVEGKGKEEIMEENAKIGEEREKTGNQFVEVQCGTPIQEDRSIGFKFMKNTTNEVDDESSSSNDKGGEEEEGEGDDYDKSPMKIPKALMKKSKGKRFAGFKMKMKAPPSVENSDDGSK